MDAASLIICLVIVGLVVYVLGKLKLLSTLAIVFLAVVLLFLVMVAVPALQVEPVYSLLKGFFEGLPDMIHRALDYVGRLLGGLNA